MLERDAFDALHDGAVFAHGFAPYMRDYRIEVQRWTDQESGELFTYRFTHCVVAESTSLQSDRVWSESWSTPTDLAAWEASGDGGFAWGVNYATVESATLVADSELARDWSARLRHPMHEALIETQVYRLRLVYHDLIVEPRSSITE